MARHNFRILLKREKLEELFITEQQKIYTEFPLKLQTFIDLENFVNKKFRDSEYFIIKVDFYVEAYLINLRTFVKIDYDYDIEAILNFDNEIILRGPMNSQKK